MEEAPPDTGFSPEAPLNKAFCMDFAEKMGRPNPSANELS
jgi:hypothetical protein